MTDKKSGDPIPPEKTKAVVSKKRKTLESTSESSPTRKGDYRENQSLITTQEEVNIILGYFGIIDVVARPAGPLERMNTPPEGYFAYTPVHIWHSGYLPLHDFFVQFLEKLGIAPLQLLPNSYTTLSCLEILARENDFSSLTATQLLSLVSVGNSPGQPSGTVYRLASHTRSVILNPINTTRKWEDQFFFVKCHTPRIRGSFTAHAPIPKKTSASTHLHQLRGDRLKLLTDVNLRKYSLILEGHQILGDLPVVRKDLSGKPTLASIDKTAFTYNTPIHLQSFDVSDIPSTLKYKSTKATSSTNIDVNALVNSLDTASNLFEECWRNDNPADFSEATTPPKGIRPSKKQAFKAIHENLVPGVENTSQFPVIADSPLKDHVTVVHFTDQNASINTPSGSFINIMDTPPVNTLQQICQDLGFSPCLNENLPQSAPDGFENLMQVVVQSPTVSTLEPIHSSNFSCEHAYVIIKNLLVVAKHVMSLQQSSHASSNQTPRLEEKINILSNQVSLLESQIKEEEKQKNEALADKDVYVIKFNAETEARKTAEKRMEEMGKEIEQARASMAKMKALEEELEPAKNETAQLNRRIADELEQAKNKSLSCLNQTIG